MGYVSSLEGNFLVGDVFLLFVAFVPYQFLRKTSATPSAPCGGLLGCLLASFLDVSRIGHLKGDGSGAGSGTPLIGVKNSPLSYPCFSGHLWELQVHS